MSNKDKPTLQFVIDDVYVANKPYIDFDVLSDKMLLDSVIGLANDYCMTLDGSCTSSVLVHLDDLERVVSEDRACNNYEKELRKYLDCTKYDIFSNSINDDDHSSTSDSGNHNTGSDQHTGGGHANDGSHDDHSADCRNLQKIFNHAQEKAKDASDNLSKANSQVAKDRQALTAAQAALTADPNNKQKQNAVTKATSVLTKDIATQAQAQTAYNAALSAVSVAQKAFDDCNK